MEGGTVTGYAAIASGLELGSAPCGASWRAEDRSRKKAERRRRGGRPATTARASREEVEVARCGLLRRGWGERHLASFEVAPTPAGGDSTAPSGRGRSPNLRVSRALSRRVTRQRSWSAPELARSPVSRYLIRRELRRSAPTMMCPARAAARRSRCRKSPTRKEVKTFDRCP